MTVYFIKIIKLVFSQFQFLFFTFWKILAKFDIDSYTKTFREMLNSRAIKFANISENKVLANNSEFTIVFEPGVEILTL